MSIPNSTLSVTASPQVSSSWIVDLSRIGSVVSCPRPHHVHDRLALRTNLSKSLPRGHKNRPRSAGTRQRHASNGRTRFLAEVVSAAQKTAKNAADRVDKTRAKRAAEAEIIRNSIIERLSRAESKRNELFRRAAQSLRQLRKSPTRCVSTEVSDCLLLNHTEGSRSQLCRRKIRATHKKALADAARKARALVVSRRVQAVSEAREHQKRVLLARHTNKLEIHVRRKHQHLKRRSAEASVDLDKIRRHEEKLSDERARRRKEIDAKLEIAERKRSIIRSGQNNRRQTLEEETRRMSVLATRIAMDTRASEAAAKTEEELVNIDPTPPTTPTLLSKLDMMDDIFLKRKKAATTLQIMWRKSYFVKQVDDYKQTSFASLIHASAEPDKNATVPSFEELSRIIRGKESIIACQKLLAKLWTVLPVKQDSNLRRMKPNFGARMLMSSLMVLHHPNAVFSNQNGEIELMVHRDAKLLVNAFSAWTVDNCSSRSSFRILCKVFDRYNQTFGIWKELDSARIIQGLVDTYMELNALKESVQDTEAKYIDDSMPDIEIAAAISASPQTREWLPKIFAQQRAIRERLCQLGASTAISEALDFQKAFILQAQENENNQRNDQTGYEIESSKQEVIFDGTSSAVNETNETKEKQHNSGVTNSAANGIEEIPHAGLIDAKLAREIIANPDFRLEKNSSPNGMEYHIKQIAERAFYDLLREELDQSPPNCRRIPSLINELRSELLGMLSENDSARRSDVLNLFDPDFIAAQIENYAFDNSKYMESVVAVLKAMCSPFRDTDVSSLRASKDIADFFHKLFGVVESMKLDFANFRLQTIRPHLVEIGVAYEREKFQECLHQGSITLVKTTEWLNKAVIALREDSSTLTLPACIESAYLCLFCTHSEEIPLVPETLELDRDRLLEWKCVLTQLHLTATIMALLKAVFPRLSDLRFDISAAILGTVKNFFEKTKGTQDGRRDTVPWLVASISKTALDALKSEGIAGSGLNRKSQALLDGQIRASVIGESPVRKVLGGRIDSYVKECIRSVASRYGSKKYVLSPPHPSLTTISKGLSEVCLKIAQLTLHNRDVHKPIYDKIIREALSS